MSEYNLAWKTEFGREMSIGWYDESDDCMIFLLNAVRASNATVTSATIKSSITTDLLVSVERRPAHPPS